MERLNILMIFECSNKPAGGTRIHVLTLSKALRKLNHKVLLFPIRPLPLDVNLFNVTTFVLQSFICFFEVIKIIQIVKKVKITILHAHNARLPLVLGYFVSRITRIPLVVTIHETWSRANKLNRLYKRADGIIAVSQEGKTILESYGVDETKLVYIPNMVDAGSFGSTAVTKDYGYKVVFIGRLAPSKIGVLKILLEATPRIVQELPATKIWIVGPRGSRFVEISRMARDINDRIGKKVIFFLGYVKDVARIIEAADIVIGVGRVALEAMVHGKPTIVGSSQDGSIFTGGLVNRENVRELEKCNFTGRNYAERMNVQQMATLIIRLLRNDGYRKIVGEFGRKFVKRRFESKGVVLEIISIYFTCLYNRSV